jgi:hypothetical protein
MVNSEFEQSQSSAGFSPIIWAGAGFPHRPMMDPSGCYLFSSTLARPTKTKKTTNITKRKELKSLKMY